MFTRIVTQLAQWTRSALWLSGTAGFSPEVNQMQGKIIPGAFRHLFHQVILDLDRIFLVREIEPLGNSGYVRIHNNTWDVEGGPQYHVGCLAAYTREFYECFHRVWHVSAVSLHQRSGTALDTFGLVAEKPGGVDKFLDYCDGRFCKGLWCRELFKESSGDSVYLLVRALGR